MLELWSMNYFLLGPDNQSYGPVDELGLRQWVAEGRVHPTTMLRIAESGMTVAASTVSGLFAPAAPPPSMASMPAYESPYNRAPAAAPENDSLFWNSVVRSALALVLFFVLHGIGLIFAGYSLYYAIQCKQSGNSKGTLAVIISSVILVIVIAGWIVRMTTHAV